MNKILLITTKGCLGCSIMSDMIDVACSKTNINIEKEVKSFEDVDKEFLRKYTITDYPTTLLIKDNKVKAVYKGVSPASTVSMWINSCFK